MGRIGVGAVAGLIFGLLQMLLLSGGGIGLLISGALLGALIGVASTKISGVGILGVAVLTGAAAFAVLALINGMRISDNAITGAVTGLIIGLIMQFVVPNIPALNGNNKSR